MPRMIVVFLAAAALALSACADVSKAKEETVEPAEMVTLDGSDQEAIVVEPEAVARVGIQTAPVEAGGNGSLTMPAAAVFYGLDGSTWTYTNPEGTTYVRVPIEVDDIQGDTAYLRDGPASGTAVVVVGAPELFGVEEGVGH
jgi:hypothetical protein